MTSQLALPLRTTIQESLLQVPSAKRIHVNRNLRLETVAWVGFDMDYTLAIYRHPEMDRLAIEATVRKMVEKFGRPESLLAMPFRSDFPIRGVHVDKKLGNVLKMDRYRYVKRAYHGMRELTKEERRQHYHSRPVRAGTKRYHWVDTLYALPEVTVYAATIEHLEQLGIEVDYAALFDEVRECIDIAHQDGSITEPIAADPEKYLERDPNLGPTLHKLRSAGKKLFLLTNSRAEYTERLMSWMLDGAVSEYPRWRSYFDVVVCASRKPRFFMETDLKFEGAEEGVAAPEQGFACGSLYQGGCLTELERLLKVASDEILYVGDHIYGDVLRAKKETAWRTMMIVQEMGAELRVHDEIHDDLARIDELHSLCETLTDELRFRQAQIKAIDREGEQRELVLGRVAPSPAAAAARVTHRRAIDRIRARLHRACEEQEELEQKVDRAFHPFWGSLFKAGPEVSSFGDQVEQYACLYTERVSNLVHYSPVHYFRGPRDRMPHEL
ncbi:MAG: HAD-IG family 5'-nucleotidase [Myxococcota bacterium]|nr:HAD-IG family 5'-nucleotidase [Myxococcota bacterium]